MVKATAQLDEARKKAIEIKTEFFHIDIRLRSGSFANAMEEYAEVINHLSSQYHSHSKVYM